MKDIAASGSFMILISSFLFLIRNVIIMAVIIIDNNINMLFSILPNSGGQEKIITSLVKFDKLASFSAATT